MCVCANCVLDLYCIVHPEPSQPLLGLLLLGANIWRVNDARSDAAVIEGCKDRKWHSLASRKIHKGIWFITVHGKQLQDGRGRTCITPWQRITRRNRKRPDGIPINTTKAFCESDCIEAGAYIKLKVGLCFSNLIYPSRLVVVRAGVLCRIPPQPFGRSIAGS